jgi:hypothetical protein
MVHQQWQNSIRHVQNINSPPHLSMHNPFLLLACLTLAILPFIFSSTAAPLISTGHDLGKRGCFGGVCDMPRFKPKSPSSNSALLTHNLAYEAPYAAENEETSSAQLPLPRPPYRRIESDEAKYYIAKAKKMIADKLEQYEIQVEESRSPLSGVPRFGQYYFEDTRALRLCQRALGEKAAIQGYLTNWIAMTRDWKRNRMARTLIDRVCKLDIKQIPFELFPFTG